MNEEHLMIVPSRQGRFGNRFRAFSALLSVSLLVLVSSGAVDPVAKSQPRAPVPNAAEIAKAEKEIHDLFKNEFASDRAGDQLNLSKRLLDQALDSTNDVASRYVLFREARDLAAKAGDLGPAWQAVDEMAKVFEVRVPAQKLPALEAVAAVTNSSSGNESLVAVTLPLAESALKADDFDTAERFIKVADRAARKAQSVSRAKSVAAMSAALDTMRKQHAIAKQASELLATDPQNADAHLTVGRYWCFDKEDWTSGLPHLARGSDDVLKALAEKTLKESDNGGVLAEIAGAWWDLAEKLPDAQRDAVRRFSAERYRAAWPKLSGLKKELAEKRIAEGGKKADRRAYTLIPLIDTNKDAIHGTWRIENNELRCETTHFVPRIQIPYQPPDQFDFIVTFKQPKLRNGVMLIMPNKHGGSFYWTVGSENGTAYCLSIGGSNTQTKLPASSVIGKNRVHTTMVQVRSDAVYGYLDGVLIRQYKTDFTDLLADSWREIKDKSLLALGCDEPTVFQAVQLVEYDGFGSGKRVR